MDAYLVANAAQVDDPWLLLLEQEYRGQVCFVNDIAARHKLYGVAKIAYWSSTKYEYANWEAALEPIHLSSDGSYYVHDNHSVVGPNGTRVTMAKCLRGYILAQYLNGDEEDPERTVCVDEYMTHALERNAAYEANYAAKQVSKSQAPRISSATPEIQSSRVSKSQRSIQKTLTLHLYQETTTRLDHSCEASCLCHAPVSHPDARGGWAAPERWFIGGFQPYVAR